MVLMAPSHSFFLDWCRNRSQRLPVLYLLAGSRPGSRIFKALDPIPDPDPRPQCCESGSVLAMPIREQGN
jgi:hypothetical protein